MKTKRLYDALAVRKREQEAAHAEFEKRATLATIRALVVAARNTYAAAQCLQSEVEAKAL